jgi:phage/plasmid-associated DNA primase
LKESGNVGHSIASTEESFVSPLLDNFQSVENSDGMKARRYNQAQEEYHNEIDRLIEFCEMIASGKASYPI